MDRAQYGRFFVGLLGGTIDIMDFISISFVVPFIAELIYPSPSFAKSLLAVVAAFAASALVRPIGGPLLGSLADRVGRKKGMYISLLGLGIAEIATGLIPTYAQAGMLAPYSLLAIRIVQGFFVAGLIASSYTIGVESFPEKYRGFLTGLTGIGGSLAHFLGSIVFLVTTLIFTGSSYTTTGWRVMFFMLGAFTFFILGFTYFVSESSTFEFAKSKGSVARAPARALFSKQDGMRRITTVAVVTVMGGLGVAFVINTFPTYLAVSVKLSKTVIAGMLVYASLIGILSNVLGGAIAHKFKTTKKLMIVYSLLFIPISFGLLYMADPAVRTSYYTVFGLVSLFYILGYVNNPINNLYVNESFPTRMRVAGVGTTWNFGFFMSGLASLVVTYVLTIPSIGIKNYPAVQTVAVILLAILYLVGSLLSRETRGNIKKEIDELEAQRSAAENAPETQI